MVCVAFPLFARTHTGLEVNFLRLTVGVVIHFLQDIPMGGEVNFLLGRYGRWSVWLFRSSLEHIQDWKSISYG